MVAILLVEDDELARKAMSFVLTTQGYEVLEAGDGQEGVDLFTQQPDAIDLVVSDLLMPCLNGLEMLQMLKCLRPQLKHIVITGAPIDEQILREQGIHDWLSKPFSMEQLLGRVATALAA